MPGPAFPAAVGSLLDHLPLVGGRLLRYRLAPHVRVCDVDGQSILLDLRSNRYHGFGGSALHEFASAIDGWPAPAPSGSRKAGAPRSGIFETLLAHGWIISASSPRSPEVLPQVALPMATETFLRRPPAAPLDLRQLSSCLASVISAGVALKFRCLLAIAEGVSVEQVSSKPLAHAVNRDDVLVATATFLHARPLLYSARDRCLHDSLALVRFLAARSLGAHWVIGVRTRPFAAHSWVQLGPLVLNDQHERVRAFRPILVV